MATRQYIGARYVPKFADPVEWDNVRSYEALTIVTHLGNSFTSKIPVPAGVDIGNTSYWVNTGNYNAQVEQYRQETEQIKNDLADYETSTNNKFGKIFSPNLRNMKNRKFVFIGDSYTQEPTPETSFVGVCAKILGITKDQYHNIGVSGADMNGFIGEVTGYTYGDESSITDVVITGGINDAHTTFASTTLRTTIPALLEQVKAKFPNATIWAGWSGGGWYTNPTLVASYPNFTYENVQNIKFLWDYTFSADADVIYMNRLDEWWRLLTETDIFNKGSGLHPSRYGITVLATNIANYLKGGSNVSANLTYGTTINMPFAIATSLHNKSGEPTIFKYDGYQEVRIPYSGSNLSSPITLSAANLTIYKWSVNPSVESNQIATNLSVKISAPLTYFLSGATNTPITASAIYELTGTEIRVCVPNLVAGVTNVVSLWIPELVFNLPANAI